MNEKLKEKLLEMIIKLGAPTIALVLIIWLGFQFLNGIVNTLEKRLEIQGNTLKVVGETLIEVRDDIRATNKDHQQFTAILSSIERRLNGEN